MWDELKAFLPKDSAAQANAAQYLVRLGAFLPDEAVVVDLGCGVGDSVDLLRRICARAKWIGVDIEHSAEVDARSRDDADFRTFDGINIPIQSGMADLVYSRQVLEHVRFPERLIPDVARVLKPGGSFVGSTSNLEPYHSSSFWNFTPLGFKRLVEEAGLTLVELRPGIDGISLIQRAYRGNDPAMNRWFSEESPLNQEIDEWAKKGGHSVQAAAFRKLVFCGHFCFWVKKPV